ncbi:fungal-specific transcription factor domain-containing protein [Ilyonectria destructans]|nr:fungal-specific transcription factor domain-containing protein [Ilyonectria destructans]
MDDLQASRKACHNCRPRKLRCDRSVPSCRKCTNSGQICLGYGKKIRFADAVASRGKLAGKRIPVLPDEPAVRSGSELPATSPCAAGDVVILSTDNRLRLRTARTPSPTPGPLTIPFTLVDPLFQDVDDTRRYYLSYYTTRLCQDMMAVDLPDNPFRQLIQLTKSSPLLQHVVIASSAAHMANSLQPPISQVLTGPLTKSYVNKEASLRTRIDALTNKQKALQLLYATLQNIEAVGSEIVLTAVIFFINLECIESGKHGWKAHIEGCGRLLKNLPFLGTPGDVFRDCIVSDYYMYYIFASVFVHEALAPPPYFHTSQTSATIRRAADISLFCSPPEILQILLAAAQLSNEKVGDDESITRITQEGIKLISDATSFDLDAWAANINSKTMGRQVMAIESRKHAGATFQQACCIYTLYAVPSIRNLLPADAEESFARDLTFHLAAITEEDLNFKTTLWPSFIAGCQATTAEQQAWVIDRLQKIAIELPWGFVYTAIDTLLVIWKTIAEGEGKQSWLQILKDPQVNFLVV